MGQEQPAANDWPFADDPRTACYTARDVLAGAPVVAVYHDYDGAWQCFAAGGAPADTAAARLVSLQEMTKFVPSLVSLHDLPHGWAAARSGKGRPWQRRRNHPFPTYDREGYYLEDAVWLSGYLLDVRPPAAEVRDNLRPGQYAKLVFRFAAEDSARADDECERMSVCVTTAGDDGLYVGEIHNDPHHDAATYGDAISFHPLHVAAVLDD